MRTGIDLLRVVVDRAADGRDDVVHAERDGRQRQEHRRRIAFDAGDRDDVVDHCRLGAVRIFLRGLEVLLGLQVGETPGFGRGGGVALGFEPFLFGSGALVREALLREGFFLIGLVAPVTEERGDTDQQCDDDDDRGFIHSGRGRR